jgi:hypothetical protein
MKALSVICVVCLSASWASAQQNSFLEIPRERGGDTLSYDLDTVQFISPGKFKIVMTEIDNPDVMKFELNTLQTLRQYCPRPDGKYPAPTELLQLGPPDLPVEMIEVSSGTRSDYPSKMVSWKYPYRRLSAKYDGLLPCTRGSRTANDLFMEVYNSIANGFRRKEIYDCKRGLKGYLVDGNDDPPKALIAPVKSGTYGEEYYRTVCRAVMHEEPYLPPPQ